MVIEEFKKLPVMGILRGIEARALASLLEAAIGSGLKAIEITMNTPAAGDLIARSKEISGGRIAVGAGTVLTRRELDTALSSGASFIVSPVLIEDVVDSCLKKNIPVFPGAFTPQEVYRASRSGASMVKVFPAKFFGPGYFNEMKGPFDNIELLACGGVNAANIADFFSCGASAVAFGAGIFKKEWICSGRFDLIAKAIKELLVAFRH